MSRRFRARFHAFATGLAVCASLFAASQNSARSGIQIRVQVGEGAINSIRLHHAHEPVVEVVDSAGNPVAGGTVTFLLPALGASGTFQDNGLSLTVQTDSRGTATGHGLRPNRIAGPFQIHVTASWQGQSASATITETNAEPIAQKNHSKTILILAIVGGAAAAGAAVAAHGGKSSTSDTGANAAGGSSGATITSGTPSLGPPH